jgi:hypothetical protein
MTDKAMTEEDEIKAAIKARLKEEGIVPEEERPAPKVKHTKPPAPLPADAVKQSSAEQDNEPQSKPAETSGDPLDQAIKDLKKDETKKEETSSVSSKQIVAGTGATAGALLRLTGRDIESGMKKSPEGTSIFSPKVTPQSYQAMQEMNKNIAASEEAMKKLDEEIRNLTRNPKASAMDFTPDQVQRILQGGEGPTMGTTGAQRGYGYNAEQQRRARTQAEIEANIRRTNPAISDPIVQAGQVVPLRSGIQVPTNVATQIAEEKAKAQYEQQKKALELQHQSEQNIKTINEQNMNKEAGLAKSRGYRSGLGKMAQGTAGGAQTGFSVYDIYQKWKNNEPIDWQDWSRLGGGLALGLGGKKTGVVGGLATLPWAYKHRDELYKGMTMPDVADPNMFTGAELFEHPEQTAEGLRTVVKQGRP